MVERLDRAGPCASALFVSILAIASACSSPDGSTPDASADARERVDSGTVEATVDGGGPLVYDAAGFPPGDPGCGLEAAAFCETFDGPRAAGGRAGELDPARWSGTRMKPQLPTQLGLVVPVMGVPVPTCRSGQPEWALPGQDVLLCSGAENVESAHALVIAGAQNYGQTSLRVRQPFDFGGGTGTIVFDAEAFLHTTLQGFVSLAVTEELQPAPSFATASNFENGALIRNGFLIELTSTCFGRGVGVSRLHVFREFVNTYVENAEPTCVGAARGRLNRFEVRVSADRVEVLAAPASEDGVTFEPVQPLFAADVSLPLTRGYVHLNTHNHATCKYSDRLSEPQHLYGWTARWDNVGFDGPRIDNTRDYGAEDPIVADTIDRVACYDAAVSGTQPRAQIGTLIPDVESGETAALTFAAVDPSDAASAVIGLSTWTLTRDNLSEYVLRYRLNDGAWHDRALDAAEIAARRELPVVPPISPDANGNIVGGQGAMSLSLEVDPSELVAGDNLLELVAVNIPQSYPPVVLNADLVVTTR